jgi:hypothetical protein
MTGKLALVTMAAAAFLVGCERRADCGRADASADCESHGGHGGGGYVGGGRGGGDADAGVTRGGFGGSGGDGGGE